MKEQLYTIPLNDAVNAGDECPFCHIERAVEQDLLDFVLGSSASYMETDVRDATDRDGFCRTHFKKMFDYGNTLGNGWILKTHYHRQNKELAAQIAKFRPKTAGFKDKFKKTPTGENSIANWIRKQETSCYVCSRFAKDYARYLDTFFVMFRRDEEFRTRIKHSKGFCLPHFGDLCEMADTKLNNDEKETFYPMVFELMQQNMARLEGDVAWLVEKFDYRNQDAGWKDSKDAIQRGMQKMKGGYPGDPIYKTAK